MSKQVKSLIEIDLTSKFEGVDAVAVLSPRGMTGIKNNALRRRLHDKGVKMTVVKNTLARRASEKSKIKGFDKLLDGPSAVIYGKASIADVARFLLAEKKTDESLELRGIFFDGEAYVGDKGIEQASKLPTREEAIGNLVALLLSPGRNLAASIKGPGGRIGGILKAIEEKGETAAPAPEAAPPAPEAAPAPTA